MKENKKDKKRGGRCECVGEEEALHFYGIKRVE